MRGWGGRDPALRLAIGVFLLGVLGGVVPGVQDRQSAGAGPEAEDGREEDFVPRERPASLGRALGGFRPLAGDLSWLRVYEAWLAREPEAVRKRIRQTVTLCPEESFFWREGARILAYDLPVWRAGRALGSGGERSYRRWKGEGAREAVALLARGRLHRPEDPVLPGEIGRLYWQRLGNPERAVRFLAEAERLAEGGRASRFRRWRILAELEADRPDRPGEETPGGRSGPGDP